MLVMLGWLRRVKIINHTVRGSLTSLIVNTSSLFIVSNIFVEQIKITLESVKRKLIRQSALWNHVTGNDVFDFQKLYLILPPRKRKEQRLKEKILQMKKLKKIKKIKSLKI